MSDAGRPAEGRKERGHHPVLLEEVLRAFRPLQGLIAVDGTTGGGGHSAALARELGADGVLLAIDRDERMLDRAKARFAEEGLDSAKGAKIVTAVSSYTQIPELLSAAGLSGADRVLLDFGFNSMQENYGFLFGPNVKVDGRYNPSEDGTRSIAQIVAEESEPELTRILREYGEDRHAARIARAIVTARAKAPIETTHQLAEIVRAAYPAKERHTGNIDAATRAFQAFRIVANDELCHVERGVRAALSVLRPGGVLACISFMSLEDRIVKRLFDEAGAPRPDPANPYRATSTEGLQFELSHRGAIKPTAEEIAANPRSRSARLRTIRRRPGTEVGQ